MTSASSEFIPPQLVQVAMASNNIPRSIQLYTKVFGFVDGRGEALWSTHLAKLQELGDEVSAWIWWLVGRQDYLQLEFFQHSTPAQQPLPDDWNASDHGWVRWGMAVPDLDVCVARLVDFGIEPACPPADLGDGIRRFTFRDPYSGNWVEVLEENALLPHGVADRHYDANPSIVYATVSVPDIEVAREFWTGTLGLAEVDSNRLHPAGSEELWDLTEVPRSFCVDTGNALIEVAEYRGGRPKSKGYLLSDQGMINIAVGYRTHDRLYELVGRLDAVGCTLTADLSAPPTPAAGYTHAPDGTSLEILAAPAEYDISLGFSPRPDNDLKDRLHGN